jgi:uncharacterized protein HemX
MPLLAVAVLAALLLGVALGFWWQGVVLPGNRRMLSDRATRLAAEQRIEAQTRRTLQVMRQAAKQADK